MFLSALEAALPLNQSHDALRGHLRKSLITAMGITEDDWSNPKRPYVIDTFPTHVVYHSEGKAWKRPYTVTQGAAGTDPEIKLGTPSPVHMAYADSKEGDVSLLMGAPEAKTAKEKDVNYTLQEDGILVTEGVAVTMVKEKGTGAVKALAKPIQVKLIQPGWGSMAYYPEAVIKRDGPNVFKKGTHMMWNHATATEEADRPEGDLNDLAAVLTKDAYWLDNGPKGAGLYSEAKVFSDYSTQVAEKGSNIGVSINAYIQAHQGSMDGREGRIADKFVHAFSADFVTKAGAGGAPIVPVQESATVRDKVKEDSSMTEAEIKAMQDKNAELEKQVRESQSKMAEMQNQQNRTLAVATVGNALKEAGINFNQKVLERACHDPKMTDGKVDEGWAKAIVADFSDGQKPGKVTNHGQTKESQGEPEEESKVTEADEKQLWKDLGVPEDGLAVAMKGGR